MSSSSRGSGPDRRGARRQRVAGLRRRQQQPGAQETGAQETDPPEQPEGPEPESAEPESGPGSADRGAETAADGSADATAGDAPESDAAAEPGDSGESGAAADADLSADRIARLPEEGPESDAADPAGDEPTAARSDAESDAAEAAEHEAAEHEAAEADESDADDDPDAAGSARRPGFGLRVALLAAATVLAGFGAWFAYETVALHTSGAAANDALVDAGATSEVNGQVGEAVTKLFSYNFAEQDKADAAADELLVGPAVAKYNELWGVLRDQAPQQKLVVDTSVKSSAVTWLQGDRAEVLLYVDQKATRAGDQEGQNEPAQLTVGAEKHGDQWKLNRITLR
ncbi:hypothetical protein IQ251_10960 [Saccharopolyspora sp. HNM0983]|uniref:Mce-associated membrane protein n=1 Tax=Saccharopolyspora montiporae TaxID=2781240 RepID=A0A929B837_9PSEU|nr:hypothetical protein [Saccharopolyspora sp. HNM0983]MBE9374959.1 hypothetical protein [Saccharopolyspora sp. HNM0983]